MTFVGQQMLFKSPINPATGYGWDGVQISEALLKMGADLHIEPKNVGVPLPVPVAELFAKERPSHFDIALNHEYPGEMKFPEGMYRHADKIVGWTMFEFTNFGPNSDMTENLAKRLASYDLVLAYDDVSRHALLEYMDDPDRLQILQGGYDSEFWKPNEEPTRRWDSTFRFCMNSTMNARKNPWAAIGGFNLLKQEYGDDFDAELHLKTTSQAFHPSLEQAIPGVKLHYLYWTQDQLKTFYSGMNCLLAPSWGEGKNLPALEAQTMGVPCIVSAFGGHMQWADPEWTYLVEGPIEEHSPEMGSIRISPETMAEKMWYVYNNRDEARRKGELASRIIPQQCDWQNILEKLFYKANATPRRNWV